MTLEWSFCFAIVLTEESASAVWEAAAMWPVAAITIED
jgi:hypothetical protein